MQCTLIIDKSGSMIIRDQKNGRSRWEACKEATISLAYKCEEKSPEGLTLYTFAGRFKKYEKVTAARVAEIYSENEPGGGTDLASVLTDALENILKKKSPISNALPDAELILIVTDGEPDDKESVSKLIADISHQINHQTDLAISFIQVGRDEGATAFLKALDDDLIKAGAKLDLVDTLTLEEIEEYTLSEIFLKAFTD